MSHELLNQALKSIRMPTPPLAASGQRKTRHDAVVLSPYYCGFADVARRATFEGTVDGSEDLACVVLRAAHALCRAHRHIVCSDAIWTYASRFRRSDDLNACDTASSRLPKTARKEAEENRHRLRRADPTLFALNRGRREQRHYTMFSNGFYPICAERPDMIACWVICSIVAQKNLSSFAAVLRTIRTRKRAVRK